MQGKSNQTGRLGLVLPGQRCRPRRKRPLGLQQASQKRYCPLQSGVIRGMSDEIATERFAQVHWREVETSDTLSKNLAPDGETVFIRQ